MPLQVFERDASARQVEVGQLRKTMYVYITYYYHGVNNL